MAAQHEVKTKEPAETHAQDLEAADVPPAPAPSTAEAGEMVVVSKDDEAESGGVLPPSQLGTRRFVYAGYFAGAIAIAFLASKVVDLAWTRAQAYRPAIGEPRDEIVMPISAVVGGATAIYFWNRTRARELADEVATEMSKVTWPTRTEVTNGTFVVIVTAILSTVFFALMDRFWGFVTNLVYGGT